MGRTGLTSEECEEQWEATEQLQSNGRLRSQHVEQRLQRCFNSLLSFTKSKTDYINQNIQISQESCRIPRRILGGNVDCNINGSRSENLDCGYRRELYSNEFLQTLLQPLEKNPLENHPSKSQ